MEKCKVNMLGLKRIACCDSGMALIFLNEKKDNSIVSVGGANYYYPDLNCLDEQFKQAIDSSKVKTEFLPQNKIPLGSFLLLQRCIPIEMNILAAKHAYEQSNCDIRL